MMRPGTRVRFRPGLSMFGPGSIPHANEAGELVAKARAPDGTHRWLVRFDLGGPLVEIHDAELEEATPLFDMAPGA